MGLDYSINLICSLIDNKTGEVKKVEEFEICYWRKCYHLCQTLIHNFAAESEYMISKDDDFRVVCKPEIVPEIENLILEELKDYDSAAWSDFIWGTIRCRRITYKQLENLTAIRKLIEVQDDIDESIHFVIPNTLEEDKQIGEFFEEFVEEGNNICNYRLKWEIEFINSY